MNKQIATKIDSEIFRFPYQETGVDYILDHWKKNSPVVLADEMGLGKTIQTIDAIIAQTKRSNIPQPKILIIVPSNSMIDQWNNEITRSELNGKLPKRLMLKELDDLDDQADKEHDLVITTYDVVTKLESSRRERSRKKRFETTHSGDSGESFAPTKHFGWLTKLEKEFDFIIFDEGHEEKSLQALNCDSTQNLRAEYKLTLTGTPIVRSAHDLLVQVYVGSNDPDIQQSVGRGGIARNAFIDAANASGKIQSLLSGNSIIKPFKDLADQPEGDKAEWALCKFAHYTITPLNTMLTAFGHLFELYWNYVLLRDRISVETEFSEAGVPEELRCQHTVHRKELELTVDTDEIDQRFDIEFMNSAGFRTLLHTTGRQVKKKEAESDGKSEARKASDDLMRPYKLEALKRHLPKESAPCVIYTKTKRSANIIGQGLPTETFLVARSVEDFNKLIERKVDGKRLVLIINEFQGLNLGMAQELVIFDEPESYPLRKQLEGRLNRFKQMHSEITFTSFSPQSLWEKWIHTTQVTQEEIINLLLSRKSFELDEASSNLESEQEKRKRAVAFSFIVKTMAEIIRNSSNEIPANALLKRFTEKQISKALAKELIKTNKKRPGSEHPDEPQAKRTKTQTQDVPEDVLDPMDWSDLFATNEGEDPFGFMNVGAGESEDNFWEFTQEDLNLDFFDLPMQTDTDALGNFFER